MGSLLARGLVRVFIAPSSRSIILCNKKEWENAALFAIFKYLGATIESKEGPKLVASCLSSSLRSSQNGAAVLSMRRSARETSDMSHFEAATKILRLAADASCR